MSSNEVPVTVNKNQKDSIFRRLFQNKKCFLELYNALNDTSYTDEEQLELVTLESAVYMSRKNDVAYVVDFQLHLYEHQSTFNPNMPLRDLFYVSNEYQKLVVNDSLYASKRVKIPAPKFVVFYNGSDKRPEREVLKLSDLYEIADENPMLELQVLVLNINSGYNQKLKEKCKTLEEYMIYVERIRSYASKEGITLQKAVEQAVDECIEEGILSDFLRINKAEAITVSIFEYDEERELRLYKAAEREVGRGEGREEGIKAFILDKIEDRIPQEEIVSKLVKRFLLSDEKARDYLKKYMTD